ncbi:biopolymer transporter ExbD [Exilibacterium tricleocarpae]|uniref:Biopolymer transporter ExbD n=1 Tax=Exilibacterium tricleocarpae TaxID=2591008 RepID=A0A545TKC1_9GAMM|nr:biopolymer transporter ExbD [Exilibacterium tricleocarpae]TQV77636.1 biopolymer transporter ExbD [Exilibacterium tricleocarpae]
MSRKNQKAEEEAGAIDLTPMLDVVFIMLIFFIVTASFIKETGIEVNRPEATTAELKKNANILVAVTENDQVWIDKRQVDQRMVRVNIERLHAENPKGAVVIQADDKASIKLLTAVAEAAREAGVFDVSVATEKK